MSAYSLISQGIRAASGLIDKFVEAATFNDADYIKEQCAEYGIDYSSISIRISENTNLHAPVPLNANFDSFDALDTLEPTMYIDAAQWTKLSSAFSAVEANEVTSETTEILKSFGLHTYRGMSGSPRIKSIDAPVPSTPTQAEKVAYVEHLNAMTLPELEAHAKETATYADSIQTGLNPDARAQSTLLSIQLNAISAIKGAKKMGIEFDVYTVFGARPVAENDKRTPD